MNSTKTLMIFSVLAVIIVLTSGCFITNCPPGGKRSAPSHRVANKQVRVSIKSNRGLKLEYMNSALVVVLQEWAVVLDLTYVAVLR